MSDAATRKGAAIHAQPTTSPILTPVPKLVLASASPRRVALLHQIGLEPDATRGAAIDETPRRAELPAHYAERMAREKADAVASGFPDHWLVAADTVVACGRRILPKAETAAEVAGCLQLLSGRRHRVLTGLCILAPDGRRRHRLVETAVIFKRLEAAEIDAYVACGEGLGKAGGYAIQGRAAMLIRRISGSYSNVVGLPLFETAQILRGFGCRW